jgi:hypothetical protein
MVRKPRTGRMLFYLKSYYYLMTLFKNLRMKLRMGFFFANGQIGILLAPPVTGIDSLKEHVIQYLSFFIDNFEIYS